MGLTDKQLEELGLKPTPKMVLALIGERLFRRDIDGWHEYETPDGYTDSGATQESLKSP